MEQKENTREDAIDLAAILYALWKHIGLIIITTVLCGAIVFVYSKSFITPMYRSVSTLFVLNRTNETVSSSDITSSTALTSDFAELATSHLVVDGVITQLGIENEYSYSKLKSEITVVVKNNTRVLEITVLDANPEMAKKLVDCVADALIKAIEEKVKMEVNKIDSGRVPEAPASPNVMKNTVLGCLVGALLAIAVIVVNLLMDDTIKSELDVEKYLQTTVLAIIPHQETEGEKGKKKKKKTQKKGKR